MARTLAFLHYLPAFEAVSRHGGVRGAADELNLSPSAVSLQMKKLSEMTGINLFERQGRNLSLTKAGSEFAQAILVSLGQIETATRTVKDGESTGRPASLNVSVPTALGVAWLSAAIVEFVEMRGIPNLVIHEAISAADVDWNACDIAVVYDNPPFAGYYWRSLSEVRLRTVCSPILFPKLDLQRRERRLTGLTLLHEDDGEEWSNWAITARVSLEGTTRVRVTSVAQAIASAVQGRGIALVSDVLTQAYLAEGRLIQPFVTSINAGRAYYILCREERSQEPVLQSFINHVIDQLHSA